MYGNFISDYDQGTTTTHTTLQVSQRLFDLVITEISARNEILIQSLLKIRFCNDVSGYLIYSLGAWASCEYIAQHRTGLYFRLLFTGNEA